MNEARLNVAAVCGSEVRVYGPADIKTSIRPLLHVRTFPHYGAAKVWAEEHDAAQKARG